jgi:hypothetical protein
MHKLRYVNENLLYVNSERLPGDKGANARGGFSIFDVSVPYKPKQVGFVDMPGSGPHRFGVDNARKLAFFPGDAPGWNKRVIWTMDISNPLKPEVLSIWGLPWQRDEGGELGNDPMPGKKPAPSMAIRGNRMYGAFWGGGMAVIDCTDLRDLKLVGHIDWFPPKPVSTWFPERGKYFNRGGRFGARAGSKLACRASRCRNKHAASCSAGKAAPWLGGTRNG